MAQLSSVEWHHRFMQQAKWTRAIRTHLFERAGLSSGCFVLEVGCGTGVIINELEKWGPNQYGLDIDINHLTCAASNPPHPNLIQGDAYQLPFPGGRFDYVFCHFLLLWLQDPRKGLDEMIRVTRPGGSVLALAEPDYGGRIDYPSSLAILGEWQAESLRRQGADPLIGRKLAGLFSNAGLTSVETGILGGQWQGSPDYDELNSEWQVMRADLVDIPGLTPATIKEYQELDRTAYQKGERVLFVPTFYAWGIVG